MADNHHHQHNHSISTHRPPPFPTSPRPRPNATARTFVTTTGSRSGQLPSLSQTPSPPQTLAPPQTTITPATAYGHRLPTRQPRPTPSNHSRDKEVREKNLGAAPWRACFPPSAALAPRRRPHSSART
ncbi:putative mastermind-like domain-containing protein 1 isoform X2 [Iris pallida]|uniref:Mastermind-like domain-containing protein 1 isoform X2 n=1 Tax=Iris pallida TaxID=29817 RepID=A0AAX6G8V4_IRIPA|nr:putative mastermind-like domain-containing protein 1 isoform X2 [Iris pallida]